MKDASVSPAGLLDPARQTRLLDALRQRFESSVAEHRALIADHARASKREAEEFQSIQTAKKNDCRLLRRSTLSVWDESEEQLVSEYETFAIENRKQQSELLAHFRRKAVKEKEAIEQKVISRCQAIGHQYEKQKHRPIETRDREIQKIDDSLQSIYSTVSEARELTIARLDHLPQSDPSVTPEGEQPMTLPKSVDEAIEQIASTTKRCRNIVDEMRRGAISKLIDSYLLPIVALVFCVLWSLGVYFFVQDKKILWVLTGFTMIAVLGFVAYLLLMWPVKKQTRRLYPVAEWLLAEAGKNADRAKAISTKIAKDASAELVKKRDTHLAAAAQWKNEQLTQLEAELEKQRDQQRTALDQSLAEKDQWFKSHYAQLAETMRVKAEAVAAEITHSLASTEQMISEKRTRLAESRWQERRRLMQRLEQGVRRGLARISKATESVEHRFPAWQNVLASPLPVDLNRIDYVPVGTLSVGSSLDEVLNEPNIDNDSVLDSISDLSIPDSLPLVLHRRLHSGLVITAPPSQLDSAIDLAHQVLWRLLAGAPPSRCKLTLLDPLGRGQNFTGFMALADHDPSIVGHRVWTSDAQINERLAELSHHVEDVLQVSLRDRFERIEDYNELAGSMAEPYRAVAAIGFPEGVSRDAYKHLLALIESGLRCGIYSILVCDSSKPWPSDMPMPKSNKILQIDIDSSGRFHVEKAGLSELAFRPCEPPTDRMRSPLVEKIGLAAVAASRVEIPLGSILKEEDAASGSTSDGIAIAVGSQGANRSMCLDLGEGVRQHVLIAGKTGSGKSTLLHAIITSGAYRYTPDELQFYLLDFKKGVEFKPYADASFPHARVIGIESEREFGRSVLQRLDGELQLRGEQFRAAGVQELGEYRRASGNAMPRIMLVVDEFQELFMRDDRLAGDCAMLLDRLVRQGRSFGMHVVLSSQSLAGAYSLPRATLGQMAVRIAMQCSESDAALILADDNTAARLIARPGEAIYNDAGGLIEGNQPFQVAWLSSAEHRELLASIADRDAEYVKSLPPAVVFEGNRPCRWTPALAKAIYPANLSQDKSLYGLLGEAVEIGPPVAIRLTRDTGRNVLIIAPPESRSSVIATCIAGFQHSDPRLELVYYDGNRVDEGETLRPWLDECGIDFKSIKMRDSEAELVRISERVKSRMDDEADHSPLVLVIDPLERFRDLRQEESFNFSLDAAAGSVSGAAALQQVLRDGPAVNVFCIVVCGSTETLSRWLPRANQHDLELRILGRMNASDSSLLIDTPIAAELSAATMLSYDDTDGRIAKFRQCDLPDAKVVRQWLENR
ncbi:FtsK-like domain-containing protein [Novipirellula aureliae]|uniref:FtsK-like domain-containing protein n=2 Tax=Novipirellula aureliae TaxID=2527966 RepID=A0A5C6E0N4_9BACT|nr:FtsK-like domain-containing protein [Novipirellula aureliae]